jgi:hypothetical protein
MILDKLKGGHLRSLGRADEVVNDILKDNSLFPDVFSGMMAKDPIIRMRSADVIEKVSSKRPDLLQPYKKKLIEDIAPIEQKEVRWHVAQMFSYIEIDEDEKRKVVTILERYLSDVSRIVVVFSLQTLANLAKRDVRMRRRRGVIIRLMMKKGSPAVISRGNNNNPTNI